MLCWAANLVEAYNKEVRVGFKDRVMVLLRPSKGGGVEDMYKLTKGRSVNFFHVLHLCKTWNFCTFSTKAHFLCKWRKIATPQPSWIALFVSRQCFRRKAPKKTLLQVTSQAFNYKGIRKLYLCTLPSSSCALGLCTVK